MEARILQNVVFFLVCVFYFSPLMVIITAQRDTPTGNIPIVNPTTPGTTPIVNPTYPPTPTFIGPPTFVSPPTSVSPPTFTDPPITMSPPTFMSPPTTTGPPTMSGGGGSWCIASASASETTLQVAIDYACGYGGADCSAIQPSGACYDPNTIRDHASYAFNDYYQKNPGPTSCVFGGAAQLTNTDPSHGNCRFASSSGTTMTPPRTNPPPTFSMPPPSTTTPPFNPYPPAGTGYGGGLEPPVSGYDYGSEPTGTPNSARTISLNLLLLITMNCLIFSVSIANHF
ncbi:hypothetical protein CASFOL_039339 [Castilleja foliolosa]|uniref:X8 domain-containing protein n=1 Tax=Castilleja foliolosa TaxID=1961234 RepID=A0ABD3BJP5_9LAMI